jgi:glycine oxidase
MNGRQRRFHALIRRYNIHMRPQHADILIIGGGVIGLSTAWFLSGEGASVLVVEQGEIGKQASWSGAGIIPPGDPAHAQTPIDLLRAHSSAMYPSLSAELREQTGTDNGFVICGGIELPDPREPHLSLPTEEWRGEGIAFKMLDHAGLLRQEPSLAADIDCGVFLPAMAQVRNPRHMKALRAGCATRGVLFETGWPVRRLASEGSRVLAVEGERGRLLARQFLLAAGAWTEALLADTAYRPGIRPIRGQIVLFKTGRPGVRPVLLQGKRYLVPRTDGRILAGSTEEDVGFDARTTDEGITELVQFAHRLIPSLKDTEVERSWAGLRPGSPDGLPYLGHIPGWENLHIAAGHFRAGLQLSPATGLVMAQHLLGKRLLLPLDAFRLDRPAAPIVQAAFRS